MNIRYNQKNVNIMLEINKRIMCLQMNILRKRSKDEGDRSF
jgi:hypothetical protein